MQFSITEKQMTRIHVGSLQTGVVDFYLVAHVEVSGCLNIWRYLQIGPEM